MKATCIVGLLALLLASGCKDELEFNPLTTLGRYNGWHIVSVESNLEDRLDAAISQIPDSTLQNRNTTREEIREQQANFVAATTGVESCEEDDVLFFEQGTSILGKTGETCSASSPVHVLDPFDIQEYFSDVNVNQITFTDPASLGETIYQVPTLTETELVLNQTRNVAATDVLPAYNYEITYRFTAR